MFSNFKYIGESQENYNSWKESMEFPPALSQEEVDALWKEIDMQPSSEHQPASVTCNEIDASTSRARLELRFLTGISSPVFTGKKIKGKGCGPIKVGLFDAITGKPIKSGPEAWAEVEIVVLKQVFSSVSDDDWMPEEFDKNIVTEWKYKNILSGIRKMNLKEGICILEDIYFRHGKHWLTKSKFRLGVRIVENFNGVRVREAKTEPFEVKDRRLEWNKKCCSPSLLDNVWRLKKICRNGPRDTRLREANIKTVKDFLILLFLDTPKLRKIYGAGGKHWEATVSHARMCTDKMVCYQSSSGKQIGAIVNASGEVLGLLSKGKSIQMDLSGSEKANANKLVTSAFEHPENVDSFDDEQDLIHDNGTTDMDDNHIDQTQLNTSNNDISWSSGECYRPMVDNHNEQTQPSTSYPQDILSWYSGECYTPPASIEQVHNTLTHYANEVDEPKVTGESTSCVGAGGGGGGCLLGMAQKRWKKLSSIWFSMRFFVKKKIGSAGFHALRLC